jgi:hypothetical protein
MSHLSLSPASVAYYTQVGSAMLCAYLTTVSRNHVHWDYHGRCTLGLRARAILAAGYAVRLGYSCTNLVLLHVVVVRDVRADYRSSPEFPFANFSKKILHARPRTPTHPEPLRSASVGVRYVLAIQEFCRRPAVSVARAPPHHQPAAHTRAQAALRWSSRPRVALY